MIIRMEKLTILTPSFNRSKLLINLYESLQQQTYKKFLWLVVDDGSKDDTEATVLNFMEKSSFRIKFLKKQNGGKHTALNYGIKNIDTELTMIVDSDDTLSADAVESILDIHEKYYYNAQIASYAFLRCNKNGTPLVPIESQEFIDNYIRYRIKGNRPGDMAEVFKTDILKAYPFPEFAGEKFLSEDVVWIEIGKKYDTVYVNKPVYVCEYLDDGLTANDKPMKFASPLGSMMRGKQLMSRECGIKANVKGAIIYNCYKMESHKKLQIDSYWNKFLIIATKFIGIIFYMRWKEE